MTDGSEKTIGEIGRGMERLEKAVEELTAEVRDRHHELAKHVDSVVVPVATLQIRMNSAEMNLVRIDGEVKGIATRSAAISGGIGVLAFIANWFKGN